MAERYGLKQGELVLGPEVELMESQETLYHRVHEWPVPGSIQILHVRVDSRCH